jgi:hypothetical protein
MVTQTEGIIENFTAEDKQAAAQTRKELLTVLDNINTRQDSLEKDFVNLGTLLEDIRKRKYWLLWDFKGWDSFIKSLEGKIKKGRSQLYNCAGIARDLLPYIPPDDLRDIGITKASALRTAVKNTGKRPSDDLVDSLKSVKVEEAAELIADDFGFRYEGAPKGDWFNLVGTDFDAEERAEFLRACSIACRVDPALPYVVTNWQDATSHQRKEILFRFIREFIATWGPEVERGS